MCKIYIFLYVYVLPSLSILITLSIVLQFQYTNHAKKNKDTPLLFWLCPLEFYVI